MKILIVDDTKIARFFTIRNLRTLGYETFIEAENVPSACEVLKRHNDIGLIICDWYMPGQTGLELLKFVRIHHTKKDIPFLIQTSDPSRTAVLSAFKMGAQSFMIKPVTLETLTEKLHEISEKGKLEKPNLPESAVPDEIHPIADDPELGFYLSDHSMLISLEYAAKAKISIPKSMRYLDCESRYMLVSTEDVDKDYAGQIEEWKKVVARGKAEGKWTTPK